MTKIKRLARHFWPYLLIVLMAVIMLWPQIHDHAFVSGYDYYFHMSRTYEAAMQIRTGHFSYFLSLFSWNHSGRIVNAVYGPLGGYASGLVLLLVHSWVRWEIVMSFIALALAGGTMYALGRYWRLSPATDLCVSTLYMLSAPVSDYVFNQMFAGFGAALLPIVVLLISEMLIEKDLSPIKWALALTLIIEVHLMTFVLSMIFVIPSVLIGIISAKGLRKRLLKRLSRALLIILILSFNVWGGLLEVLGSNCHHLIPTFPGTHLGRESYSAILNTYPRTSLLQTPSLIGAGVAVLLTVTVIEWLTRLKRVNHMMDWLVAGGLVQIWIASGYFPWTFVERHAYSAATLIQFPKRFLPLGLILMYLGAGYLLSRITQSKRVVKSIGIIMLLILIGWGWRDNWETYQTYIRTYNSGQVINWHRWTNMHWQKRRSADQLRGQLHNGRPGQFLATVTNPVPDYLPTSVVYRGPEQYRPLNPVARYQQSIEHRPDFRWKALSHGRLAIQLRSRDRSVRTVPFFEYAHTRVVLNHHVIRPSVDRIGAMSLPLNPGRNRLIIQYRPSVWYRIGIWISILAWLGLLISLIRFISY